MYYTIFGSCLKGTRCNNADGHTPEGRVRTGAWLKEKLNEIPHPGPKGPVKLMNGDQRGPR